ncbi:hypothetical protein [Tepidibacter formicigenes]|jgi:hypothetical protein|uniref:Uncharacterized protein n=1 Tax=Tepidibacter formicigenes DSM 15518 TaxID=1123349 RepID=A0A1M6PGF9_9FIRM|nr:hypothetical protein [Tepidibacter formicigenes]SHK07023.1 hypothetical protein SAMN02744037_01555 [Tepidibacter formicigenes DSM 15518]
MKKIVPPKKLIKYKWGGKTFEWLEETKEINAQIEDAQEELKSKKEIKKEIAYGSIKQRWN